MSNKDQVELFINDESFSLIDIQLHSQIDVEVRSEDVVLTQEVNGVLEEKTLYRKTRGDMIELFRHITTLF